MKHLLFLTAFTVLLMSCAKEELSNTSTSHVELIVEGEFEPLTLSDPLTTSQINDLAEEQLRANDIVNWENMSDVALWSAVVRTDSLVSIGYQPQGFLNIKDKMHQIDVNETNWANVKKALIEYVVDETNRLHPVGLVQKEDILAFGDKPLPYINIKISDYEILASLRRMNVVRYVEPTGYGTEVDLRALGCGGNGQDWSIGNNDYDVISPNAKVSWNYDYMNIQEAWNESQGDNITVGLIDTGLSPSQSKLNGQFSSGESTNRWREKEGFFETCFWWWCWSDGPDDDCGHGTSMAGTIAAPRTSAGSTVGVAYKANLISCRGTDDVVLNSSNEKDGVSDSYYYLGSNGDVKIISMSLGDVFWSGQIADAIYYAHNNGKMIFNAAGTSLSWTSWWGVIFPANMNETIAVTGIKNGSSMVKCDECHSGSQVDFTIVMQDANDSDRYAITLANTGNQPTYIGGSSIATATTAGIAALVWAEDPSYTREEVLEFMKNSASFYPNRNSSFGWGLLDAQEAVELAAE